MIPRYPEETHYENWANNFAAAAIALECEASIHVEDNDDITFWKQIFKHYCPDKKYNFLPYSQSPKGNKTTGVNQCLKYKPYLNKRFFICIDSDYRYLMQEEGFDIGNFVFQTYTYSFENHLCYAESLNEITLKSSGLPNRIFDFKLFLQKYSITVYEALIWHLYFIKQESGLFPIKEFSDLISLKGSVPDYDIENNGNAVLAELHRRCSDKTRSLTLHHQHIDIQDIKETYKSLGLLPDTAYLYVRGHNLYDLICDIGKLTDKKLLEREKYRLGKNKEAIKRLYRSVGNFQAELDKHIDFDMYPEIQKIAYDIRDFDR